MFQARAGRSHQQGKHLPGIIRMPQYTAHVPSAACPKASCNAAQLYVLCHNSFNCTSCCSHPAVTSSAVAAECTRAQHQSELAFYPSQGSCIASLCQSRSVYSTLRTLCWASTTKTTDVHTAHDLRAVQQEAGADASYIEGPRSIEELKTIAQRQKVPGLTPP